MGKRAGRRRKAGVVREPNGRVSRVGQPRVDPTAVVRAQPHRRWLGDAWTDQRADCEIGRLRLLGEHTHDRGGITAAQYDAAVAYRRDAANMLRAIDARRPWVSGQDLTGGGGGTGADLDEATAATYRRRYADAYGALMDAPRAHDVAVVVADVVGRDMAIGDRLDLLLVGLDILANYYGCGKSRKVA